MGTISALNQRTSEGYAAWLDEIRERLDKIGGASPYGVNLIVHKTNARLSADVEITVKHRVPVVITSLGELKWDSASGCYFVIDRKLDMFFVLMEQTPTERVRIQAAVKKLIYEALEN